MILDQLIALRVLYILVTPFTKQEAYKLGVIDENGDVKLKINDMNPAQKSSYTMLHRLCFRLKKVLGKLPFGKTTLASMAAAYVLVRENLESENEPENLELIFEERLNDSTLLESNIDESDISNLFALLEKVLTDFNSLAEDGVVTNNTGGLSAVQNNTPVIKPKKSIILSRDRFNMVKANRKLLDEMYVGLNIDIVLCEETQECLVL